MSTLFFEHGVLGVSGLLPSLISLQKELGVISSMTAYQLHGADQWVKLSFSPVSPLLLVIRISRAPLQTSRFSRAGQDWGIRILTLSYPGDGLGITDLGCGG